MNENRVSEQTNQSGMSLTDFLKKEIDCCFRCGSKDYKEISIKDVFFRLCDKCEKHPDVINHFKKIIKGQIALRRNSIQ